MAKITLPSIGGGYATTTQLNAAFTQIEDEFQNKVLYRDNTSAESNVMENDIDLNNNDLNNIGNVDCDTITVAGVSLTAQVAAAAASATAAAASAAAAAVSASNASSSASTATASATSATSSASSATASAATATTQAAIAVTQANAAAASAASASSSASAASTSATNASTSASNASTSATTATTQASNASTSATNAAASATAAAASYDAFDDRYLGSFATAPTVDNDGNPLLTGAIYWNTVASQLYIWTGSAWNAAAFSVSGAVTTFQTSLSGLTPSTGTSGAITLAGTLGTANGGTGSTSTTYANLASNVTGTLPIANGGTGTTSTTFTNLTTNVTGTLPVANGGTNSTATATAGGAGYGTGTAHAYTAAGTTGQALISAGASAPSFGTLGVAGGGTGLATLTANNVLLGNGTSAPTFVAPSTSGNLLTSNGTTWTSSTPATPNTAGGATTVSQGTSLTLTSASNRVQNVTLTASNLSVILPDATTLSAGGPTFIINNGGTNTFSIQLNGGIVLTSLTSGQSIMLEVYDITTAAGLWLVSNKDVASQALYSVGNFVPATIDSTNAASDYITGYLNGSMGGNATANHFVDCLKLTSTTALLVWTRTGNKSVYGVVATNTSGVISYGTIVQIYDGSAGGVAAVNTAAAMLLTGLTTGMVFIGRSATGVVVPFSISGTTITVGTASANIGNKAGYMNVFHSIAVLSSTVTMIVYNNTTQTQILVATVTYNGASAPTLGTPTAGIAVFDVNAQAPFGFLLTLTSTTLQLWYISAANTLATRVVTSNGASAPTLGTAITATVVAAQGPIGDMTWQPYAYSATETSMVFYPQYNSVINVASYTISGTTITQTVAPVAMSNPNSIGLCSRIEWVTSTTGLFYWSTSSGGGNLNRYPTLSKIYKVTYTPSGGTILYSGVGNTPDSATYSYLAGMCLLSSTTGIVAGYNSTTGYISANVFSVL